MDIKKVIKWSLIALVGLFVLAILTPDKEIVYEEKIVEIEKIVEVEKIIEIPAICDKEQKIIKLYDDILTLDNEVFGLTATVFENIFDIANTEKVTEQINIIAAEKELKLLELYFLQQK